MLLRLALSIALLANDSNYVTLSHAEDPPPWFDLNSRCLSNHYTRPFISLERVDLTSDTPTVQFRVSTSFYQAKTFLEFRGQVTELATTLARKDSAVGGYGTGHYIANVVRPDGLDFAKIYVEITNTKGCPTQPPEYLTEFRFNT